MSILFINGSPNKNGNTAALAAELLKGKEYETLNLTDYTIGAYGQNLPGDGLDAVIAAMKQADTIVIGSPVYWHNICGSIRNVLDPTARWRTANYPDANCILCFRAQLRKNGCWRRASTP